MSGGLVTWQGPSHLPAPTHLSCSSVLIIFVLLSWRVIIYTTAAALSLSVWMVAPPGELTLGEEGSGPRPALKAGGWLTGTLDWKTATSTANCRLYYTVAVKGRRN